MNYADEAARYFELERQEQLKFKRRSDVINARARRSIEARVKSWPKGLQANKELYVTHLAREMRSEDLIRSEHLANQQHYLRLAQAYAMEAMRVGHEPTGVRHAV
jgi:hypothetical protein